MPISGISEPKRKEIEDASRVEMERLSKQLGELILSQSPKDLLGYVWSQLLMRATSHKSSAESNQQRSEDEAAAPNRDRHDLVQFVLEYVHATLVSFQEANGQTLSELVCVEIFEVAEKLRVATLNYCMFSSAGTDAGVFGPLTGEIEFTAKSNWVMIRGHRYQVLEREFFEFVLAPHDAALREIYGVDSGEIASGFQAIADSMREGHMRAVSAIEASMKEAQAFAKRRGLSFENAAEAWRDDQPTQLKKTSVAFNNLFRGGICNLSSQTALPETLLSDLSFERGEQKDFFYPGDFSGTPLRTLPARVKPLVKLNDGYYATDLAFVRDSGYRSLQRGLLQRKPDYREIWNSKQKTLSESAFVRIFVNQLDGAEVHNEIYYKDVDTGQWVENDVLIILDDVFLQLEAKAGSAAFIESPALNFDRHVRAIQELILNAYKQSARFFKYLNSADEVPIFNLSGGKYNEIRRIKLSDFRIAIPIGLTVESFSPFSAMCKELPDLSPILGLHPFVSMSIDDLFVLNRFLPTAGELSHYLEVRQAVAGIKGARLFDEIDHLGAYISRNRFDIDLRDQLAQPANFVLWDGFSEKVDRYFEGERWKETTPPRQECPREVMDLLAALDSTKAVGWLRADSHIRNLGAEGRQNLAGMLSQTRQTLGVHESRWLQIGDHPPLFIWLQRAGTLIDTNRIRFKVKAAAIATGADNIVTVLAFAKQNGGYVRAELLGIDVPSPSDPEIAALREEAEKMKQRAFSIRSPERELHSEGKQKKIRRNEPCWCGSGKKFKKCHGSTV